MGIGYTLTVVLMASIREILGSGTWLGFQVLPESMAKMSIMTQAPGAFFCYGVLMAKLRLAGRQAGCPHRAQELLRPRQPEEGGRIRC